MKTQYELISTSIVLKDEANNFWTLFTRKLPDEIFITVIVYKNSSVHSHFCVSGFVKTKTQALKIIRKAVELEANYKNGFSPNYHMFIKL